MANLVHFYKMGQCNINQAIILDNMQSIGTNQITLVSFKNIDIWLIYGPNKSYMPIFEHTFLSHYNSAIITQPFLGQLDWKIVMGTQETIIYRLVIRNPKYDAYFSFLIFYATFGGKIGVVTTCAPNH